MEDRDPFPKSIVCTVNSNSGKRSPYKTHFPTSPLPHLGTIHHNVKQGSSGDKIRR